MAKDKLKPPSFEKIPRGTHLVIGRNAVREVLLHRSDQLLKVFTINRAGKRKGREGELLSLAQEKRIATQFMSPEELDTLVETDNHQSFAALVREKEAPGLKDWLRQSKEQDSALVLILDSVEDPGNLGALLRAAECFGTSLVIVPKTRTASFTPAVSKTSVGASELLDVIKVSNLVDAVSKLKEAEFWVAGGAVGEDATDVNRFEFPKKTALVVGAEGKGISHLLLQHLDFKLSIPLSGRIDSLNVSQAASILLYCYRRSLSSEEPVPR